MLNLKFLDMKKIVKILCLIIIIYSCAENKDAENIREIIDPIVPNNEVVVFFEKHLPPPSFSPSECFFLKENNEKCLIINNETDFRKSFSCSPDLLPEIDFDLFSLVIGQHQVALICPYIVDQYIVDESTKMELNIKAKCPDDNVWPSFGTLYFWGIYPKLKNKPISINMN
jgi:hypothetical protein